MKRSPQGARTVREEKRFFLFQKSRGGFPEREWVEIHVERAPPHTRKRKENESEELRFSASSILGLPPPLSLSPSEASSPSKATTTVFLLLLRSSSKGCSEREKKRDSLSGVEKLSSLDAEMSTTRRCATCEETREARGKNDGFLKSVLRCLET